jgi:hypothetical protein
VCLLKKAKVGELAKACEAPHETRSFLNKLYRGAKAGQGYG